MGNDNTPSGQARVHGGITASQPQADNNRPYNAEAYKGQPVRESDVTYGRPAGAVDES